MADNIYWIYDEKNIDFPSEMKLLIVGQSGSGKTILARYLCNKYPDIFEIIKNCTTRPKRAEDKDNFCYLSVKEFYEATESEKFFLARFGSDPLYGYKKRDYNQIVCAKKIPIFMFRFSGLQHLQNLLQNYFVIFLISDLENSIIHSNDEVNQNLREESTNIKIEIRKAISEFNVSSRKYAVVNNNYTNDFFDEIDKLDIVNLLRNDD